MGGVLVDLQTGKRYVPKFNSLVAFRIPRCVGGQLCAGRSGLMLPLGPLRRGASPPSAPP
jgi:hypothetical protein